MLLLVFKTSVSVLISTKQEILIVNHRRPSPPIFVCFFQDLTYLLLSKLLINISTLCSENKCDHISDISDASECLKCTNESDASLNQVQAWHSSYHAKKYHLHVNLTFSLVQSYAIPIEHNISQDLVLKILEVYVEMNNQNLMHSLIFLFPALLYLLLKELARLRNAYCAYTDTQMSSKPIIEAILIIQ